MEKDSIDILLGVGTALATAISGYIGLKLKALKSEMKENHISKDDYKNDNDSLDTKFKDIDDRLRATETNISVTDDRVKAIFKQMDKNTKQIGDQFSKLEVILRDLRKDLKDDFEKRDDQVRAMIKELYQTKEDKK